MRWWKRLLFTLVSLVWGFVSLDYLYLAFQYLTNAKQANNLADPKSGINVLAGTGMFLVWFLLMAVYTILLRSASPKIDLLEEDKKTGETKIRRKWFDIILQYAFIITGAICRWLYLIIIYFPNR